MFFSVFDQINLFVMKPETQELQIVLKFLLPLLEIHTRHEVILRIPLLKNVVRNKTYKKVFTASKFGFEREIQQSSLT